MTTKTTSDPVNHPYHYTAHPSGIETIEVTRWMTFNLGNVMKYVWRAGSKGDQLEDLRKAQWYLNDEIVRLEKLHEQANQAVEEKLKEYAPTPNTVSITRADPGLKIFNVYGGNRAGDPYPDNDRPA